MLKKYNVPSPSNDILVVTGVETMTHRVKNMRRVTHFDKLCGDNDTRDTFCENNHTQIVGTTLFIKFVGTIIHSWYNCGDINTLLIKLWGQLHITHS